MSLIWILYIANAIFVSFNIWFDRSSEYFGLLTRSLWLSIVKEFFFCRVTFDHKETRGDESWVSKWCVSCLVYFASMSCLFVSTVLDKSSGSSIPLTKLLILLIVKALFLSSMSLIWLFFIVNLIFVIFKIYFDRSSESFALLTRSLRL